MGRVAFVVCMLLAGAVVVGAPAIAQVNGTCVANCDGPPMPPPQPPPPPPRAGAAAEVSGDVTFIYPDGSRHMAAPGEPLPIGSRVIIGPTGSLKVMLLDETVFSMGPNSDMVIDEYVYDPDTHEDRFVSKILKGVFRFVAGKMGHRPDQWRVSLPTGTIGIRGTTFDVDAEPDGSGEIAVEEGEIVLTEYDSEKEWMVDAGHKLVVENFQIKGLE